MSPPAFRLEEGFQPRHAAAVRAVLSEAGWVEATGDSHQLLVAPDAPPLSAFRDAGGSRRINHVWGTECLTRPHLLRRIVATAEQRLARTFFPPTYALPDDAAALRMAAAHDPQAAWISCSKAHVDERRPIRFAGDPPTDARWLIQRQVDRDTIDGRAYSIRLIVLLASVDPLAAYRYSDGRVVFEPATDGAAPQPESTWDLDRFARHLAEHGGAIEAWSESVDAALAATIAAARESIQESAAGLKLGTDGTFELLEAVFDIDRSCRPWLTGFRSWPPARAGAGRGRRSDPFAAGVLREALGLVGALNAPAPRFGRLFPSPAIDRLALLGSLTNADVREAQRCALEPGAAAGAVHAAASARHFVLDDRLVLFGGRARELYVLNPTASFVWLRASEGLPPRAIVDEIAQLFPGNTAAVERDVWTSTARWFGQGLLETDAPPMPSPALRGPSPHRRWNAGERIYRCLGWRTCVRTPGGDLDNLVYPTLSLLEAPGEREFDGVVEIVSAPGGYEILADGSPTVGGLSAAAVAPAVHRRLLEGSYTGVGVLLGLRATVVEGPTAFLLLDAGADERTGLADALSRAGCRVRPREALLVRGTGVARRDEPHGDLGVRAIVVQLAATARQPAAVEALSRGDALRALLNEDPDMVSVLSAEGVEALVAWMSSLACARVVVGAAETAASLLVEMAARVAP